MRSTTPLAAFALIAGTTLSLSAPRAHATILSWSNGAGGSASTPSNWNPIQAPTGSDSLVFNIAGAYAVTFSGTSAASVAHTYRKGTVTVTCSSTHTGTGGLIVGDVSGDAGNLTLTTGVLQFAGSALVGNSTGSSGTLAVNDDDADLVLTGVSSDMTVGVNAPGALLITGGGSVTVPDQFIVGSNASATSTLTVSGALSTVPFTRSTLLVNGASQSRLGQGGDATVSIASGARAQFAGPVVISNGSASASTVTVAGSSVLSRATLDVAGNLDLSKNGTPASAGGVSTLAIGSGGTVLCGATLAVAGDPDGGTATLRLTGDGVCTTTSLAIGAGGTLDFQGGTLTIDGGSLTLPNPGDALNLSGAGAGDNPTARFIGASTTTIGNSVGVGVVGGRSATLEVLGHSLFQQSAGGLNFGVSTGSTGTARVSDAGSRLVARMTRVGVSGAGNLTVESSAAMTSNGIEIGSAVGGGGVATVRTGATWTNLSGSLVVGGTTSAQGGVGTLTIESGGGVTSPGTLVWPGSAINITDATLDAGGMNSSGVVTLAGGTLRSSDLFVHLNGAIVAASGVCTIDARCHTDPSVTVSASGGDLTIGDATDGLGIQFTGSLSVGSRTVTLRDQNLAVIADTSLAGGTLAAANGVRVDAGETVTGFGTLAGAVDLMGTLAPSGTGLRVGGIVTRNGGTISGTTIGFNAGGGYTGDGTISADVDSDPGSTIAATGSLSMGRAASNFGCTLDGTLLCQNHAVTLLDANGVGLPVLTDLGTANGVRLICAQNLTVNTGRVLQGKGSVQAPLLSVLGVVKPGDAVFFNSDALPGTIGVTGNFSMGANAHFHCQIGDPTEGTNMDRISVTGSAAVNGSIHVSLFGGFVPQVGDFFDVITGSTRSGAFTTEDCPGFHVVYLADRVRLVFDGLPCDGDMNCDGNADQDDVTCLISTIAGDSGCFCQSDADLTHDGNADQDDVLFLINMVAGGGC